MYLTKLTLDVRHPGARRDLSDAYDLHRTLSRAFAPDDQSVPARFLWRLEPSRSAEIGNEVLVQSAVSGCWSVIEAMSGYLQALHPNKYVDPASILQASATCRFRLRANPTITRSGKRMGLVKEDEQMAWLGRQGERLGFSIKDAARLSSAKMVLRSGQGRPPLTLLIALFKGVLRVQDPGAVERALVDGVGHGKAFGLGMLSIAPVRGPSP